MARIRSIKPEFFTDEQIAALPALLRLAFQGLWCHADKAGRLEDRPARLKVQILPYDNVEFDDALRSLAAAGFIRRYVGPDGRGYLQIRSFAKHQRPRDDEPESQIPPPQVDAPGETGASLDSDGLVTAQSVGTEGKGTEGKGREISPEPLRDSEPAIRGLSEARVVLEFPVVGTGGKTWQLLEAQVAEWATSFPGLDILAQCRAALAWLRVNPGRRKTDKGMARFLVNWLTRTVDSGRAAMPQRSGPTPAERLAAATTTGDAWRCPHVEPCHQHRMCSFRLANPDRFPLKQAAS